MDLKMEVYTPGLELLGLLEIQNSVIWENKAFGAGSFSVTSILTADTRPLLSAENIIWIAGDEAGVIEYINQEAEESANINVKGCNLTGLLARRILWGRYDLSGTPPQIMHHLVNECAVNPTRGDVQARKIPGLVLLDPPTGGASIRIQRTGGELLETLEELGETYGVAFGIRFNPSVPQMEFWTRWGVNRSIRQSVNDPVFYSTELDDVLSSEYTYNSQDYRNVALIAGEGEGNDRVMVTVEGEDETYIPDVPTPEPTPDKYTITLSVDPSGGGVATGGGTVNGGTSVTVTAAPAQKYGFVGWRENGKIIITEPAYTFTVNRNRNLTAVFVSTVTMYTVTVVADPTGGGTVSGGGSVEEGQSVTLTQTTATGYRFSGWYSGSTLLSTASPYTFTPTGNITVAAKFAAIPVYTITATIDPSGSGTVTGAGMYQEGTQATITATPAEGYTFNGWTENGATVSTSASYTFTVTGNRALAAGFVEKVSRLPEGYTELKYIESTGTQYISTDVKPAITTKMVMDVEVTDTGTGFLFGGTRYLNKLNYRYDMFSSSNYFYVAVCNASSSYTPIATEENVLRRVSIEFAPQDGTVRIDSVAHSISAPVSLNSAYMVNLYLLGRNYNGAVRQPAKAKLYSAQIYGGTSLVKDFVPCTNPSGAVGLYDLVSGSFFGNAGTGTFVAGPAV